MGARTALHVEELHRQYSQRVYGYVYRRTSDVQSAQQITNDVFRIAWQHQKEPSEDALPWLLVTARNLVANEYRAQRRQRSLIEKLGSSELARRPQPENDPGAAVREVLNTLRPQEREILMLAYWDSLSLNEISTILRCSPDSAKSRLFRARKAFSKKAPNQMLKGGTSNGQH
ncbi:sigma-70 family RNA polymerase sigma factor [Paeniglutamicibacter sp. ABSL32-1]|uniref:RNA polymerase sigma factor n=1 Tax=Paeniglutamicibacter quisquiliarum TaxID=2849498 RepID=UPI001C2D2394|nr:sigma-70 family RNA polymerase sigma factor [Paeniglutamicibacter quisquiliarum]MBV1780478.1 sigma-70 family RNA polymerase sigma factor [Paeniglutamicibacter quisquiliarum]